MRNKLLLLLFSCFCARTAGAQDIYMPRNIKMAYQAQTRSLNGLPGKDYWQNTGDYDINVTVDAVQKSVSGNETIVYYNNSPDSLQYICIRFVNNIHKPESPRAGQVSKDFLTSGLHVRSFKIDGNELKVNSDDWGTVKAIKVPGPVLPHSKIRLEIAWDYPLSKQSGREGQIDSTTFYCAYSYPRVSVYDDYNGWDMLPHTDGQEFYNDFNNYTLSVKAPKNYTVWATGDFLDPEAVLQPAVLSRLQQSYTSDSVIHIATAADVKNESVTLQNDWNTWKFKADSISDICFALSKTFVWDATSVVVDPANGRRAAVAAVYNDTAADFRQMAKWSAYALKYFSVQWPGVPYPYSNMTAFQGFADMEYPMMINDATTQNHKFAEMVADHEIAHTYFPFYMGINETRYAYMDEGWATTLEYLIAKDTYGKAYADSAYKVFRVIRWITNPTTEMDQPLITMSSQLSGAGYGRNAYVKASLSYLALKDLLGDSLFKKALHAYMDHWHSRHPIPWDYFYSINTATQENLNWFWNNWFFTNNYIDLAVGTVSVKNMGKEGYSCQVTIKNTGGFAIPFDVIVAFGDGRQQIVHQSPKIWTSNPKQAMVNIKTGKNEKIKSIQLDGGIFMDATPEDNTYTLPASPH